MFVNKYTVLLALTFSMPCPAKEVSITKFEMCNTNQNYPVIMYGFVQNKNNGIHMTVNSTVKEPLGDNSSLKLELFFCRDGRNFIKTITWQENLCTALKKYGGQLALDIQREAQVTPGMCPIPPGTYHLNNYRLNVNLIPVPIPKGQMRIISRLTEIKTGKEQMCMILEVKVDN